MEVVETDEVRKFRKELNSGAVSLVLMALLERATAPMYGYQIARCLEEAAGGEPLVKQGTLYPLLRTMESNGLLQSEVEPSVTGPPRRYYTITSQGRDLLPVWRGVWEQTRDFVDSILGRASPAPPRTAASEQGGGHESVAPPDTAAAEQRGGSHESPPPPVPAASERGGSSDESPPSPVPAASERGGSSHEVDAGQR